jgi:peptidoglycan-associated lipoprotein
MKKSMFIPLLFACIGCLLLEGCKKKNGDVWDDSNTALGSYKRAKERVLWGSNDVQEASVVTTATPFSSVAEDDFISLQDDDIKEQFSELVFAQPKVSPGDEGSFLPGIDGFLTPMGSLVEVFKNIYFNTDEYNPKDAEGNATIRTVATYLKSHPKTYIFVTGNCDQRGPEAYNQTLGMKRANSIRSLLIQQGVSPEQVHTISYGKEKLVDTRSTPEAWAKNRRAEFKIFNKK